jgi:hypothetical protein
VSDVKLYVVEVNDLHAMLDALAEMLAKVSPKLATLYADSIEIKMRHDGGDRDVFTVYWDPEQEDFRVEVLT